MAYLAIIITIISSVLIVRITILYHLTPLDITRMIQKQNPKPLRNLDAIGQKTPP